MNSQIKILDDSTINLIAAGEVIERPASIVKELVENSLDAKSTSITIEIQGSGQPYIRISDNGNGMSKDDLLIAIERHATSKIQDASDLFNIKTYGFRGEALPSIAGISKLHISTKKNNNGISGTDMLIEAGKILRIEERGIPEGTTITVKDVFYNLPARRKYIKKDITEYTHIYNMLEKFMMANPNVKFKLIHDGNEIISSLGNGELFDVLIMLYGVILKDKLLKIENITGSIKITGYIGNPQISYLSRSKESVFVNGRFVYAPIITRAVEEEYKNLIPNGRYPFAVIIIDIDPNKIDVNVHPAKKEIRFEKMNEVLSMVKRAVRETLAENGIERIMNPEIEIHNIDSGTKENGANRTLWTSEDIKPDFEFSTLDNATLSDINKEPCFQYKNTYLITIIEDKIVIIDQHVAHERIIYEKLSKDNLDNNPAQELLVPLNFTVSPIEKKIVLDISLELKRLGYHLEEFGNNEFILRSVPADLYEKDHVELLRDLIEEFKEDKSRKNIENIREKILITISCKSAVKAGQTLQNDEMMGLIKDLKNTSHPYTCPHGRPIIYSLTEESLQKFFKRR